MHLGTWQDHSMGCFLQQPPAALPPSPQLTILQLQTETSAEKFGCWAKLKHTPLSATAASHALQKSNEMECKTESWTCRWRKYIREKHVKGWIRNLYPKQDKMQEDFYSRPGYTEGCKKKNKSVQKLERGPIWKKERRSILSTAKGKLRLILQSLRQKSKSS